MKTISPKDLSARIEQGDVPILLDVREPAEHDAYNIGGKLIPLGNISSMQIEEIEDLGRSEYRALVSAIEQLSLHLLKWQFQPNHRSPSWKMSIDKQRIQLERLLEDNPGLRQQLDEMIAKGGAAARGSDEYVNSNAELMKLLSEAQRVGHQMEQSKDFVTKYGTRAIL